VAAVERGAGGHGKSSLVTRPTGPGRALAAARRPSKKADRAPSVEAGTRGAASVTRLRLGTPLAPEGGRLRLLPSGPDLVHGSSSPRDRTIDVAHRALTPGPVPLGRGFSPARADCGYRAPLAPRLARSRQDPSAPGAKNEAVRIVVFSGGVAGRGAPALHRYLAHTPPTTPEARRDMKVGVVGLGMSGCRWRSRSPKPGTTSSHWMSIR